MSSHWRVPFGYTGYGVGMYDTVRTSAKPGARSVLSRTFANSWQYLWYRYVVEREQESEYGCVQRKIVNMQEFPNDVYRYFRVYVFRDVRVGGPVGAHASRKRLSHHTQW